jgi:hypothetical protein
MKEYSPISLSEVQHYVDLCKNVPRDQAEVMQKFLMRRALETGVTSHEVLEKIQSISDRFVEEDKEMRRKLIEEELRRRGTIALEPIEADDDQIVKAIKKTLPKFNSDKDWGGIYRILVECCHFPPNYSDFVRKFDEMGIFPADNTVKGIKRCGIPAISERDYHNHRFNYQALQKSIENDWPKTYIGWMNSHNTDRDFTSRRDIATIFYKNIKAEVGA